MEALLVVIGILAFSDIQTQDQALVRLFPVNFHIDDPSHIRPCRQNGELVP